MTSIHKTLFNSLDKILNKADRLKYDQHFVTHEGSDFTRKSRKLSFKDTISFILSMAGKPIREELLDFFHYSNNTPTASALGIKNPFGEGSIGVLEAEDCAVVTSGNYERYFTDDGNV